MKVHLLKKINKSKQKRQKYKQRMFVCKISHVGLSLSLINFFHLLRANINGGMLVRAHAFAHYFCLGLMSSR